MGDLKGRPKTGRRTILYALCYGLGILLSVLFWCLSFKLLTQANLLHAQNFILLMLGILLYFTALLIVPLLMVRSLIYSWKRKRPAFVLWMAALNLVITLLLGLMNDSVYSSLPAGNGTLFAEKLSFEQIVDKVEKKTPGFYILSTWNETGTFFNEARFFAQWIDFPSEYLVETPVYYYHDGTKNRSYAADLEDLMEKYDIKQLPVILVISAEGEIKDFQGIGTSSILKDQAPPAQRFIDYLDEHDQHLDG